jgi:hypothetical protein
MLKYRIGLLVGAVALVPIGYSVRFAPQVPEWFRNVWGNGAYETLLIVLLLLALPRLKPWRAAVIICLVTFGLEFLQLSQDPTLVAMRANKLGRLILGNGFTWEDFPLYMLGSTLGWWLTRGWRRFCLGNVD